MRITLFVNGRVGLDAVKWLRNENAEIAGIVVHPDSNARFKAEILDAAGLPETRVLKAQDIKTEQGVEKLKSFNADIGVSLYFAYILKTDVIDLFPEGVVNLHPAYLPFNRGRFTNVWSIVDSTPAGVSIHYIDRTVDTGDIVARREIEVGPFDTGRTLHEKLESESFKLFCETWPQIASGTASRMPQDRTEGTFHRARDVDDIDRIELDREYKARDLLNVIRARTFAPYSGAYYEENGERVYLRIELLREEEL